MQIYHHRCEWGETMTGFGRKVRAGLAGNKRKTERSITFASAIVETPASRHHVTIIDISQYGARISGTMPSVARRELRIRVNEIDLFGTVAWRKDNSLGIKFEEILSDHNSTDICKVVVSAEAYSRQFDREASLQALANGPPGVPPITALFETNATSTSSPAN